LADPDRGVVSLAAVIIESRATDATRATVDALAEWADAIPASAWPWLAPGGRGLAAAELGLRGAIPVDVATDRCGAAVEAARGGHQRGLVMALMAFARFHGILGDSRAAFDAAVEGLDIAERSGLLANVGGCANMAGRIAGRNEDYDTARRFLERALAVARELGDTARALWVEHDLAHVLAGLGEVEAARALVVSLLEEAEEALSGGSLTTILTSSAYALVLAGDEVYGDALAQRAIELTPPGHAVTGAVMHTAGEAALLAGDSSRAWSRFVACVRAEERYRHERSLVLAGFAGALLDSDPTAAAALLGAESTSRGTGVLLGAELRTIEARVNTARHALGADAFHEAWKRGSSMTYGAAIEYALSLDPPPRSDRMPSRLNASPES
jgi:tetratricopeptide (TPR) repeat protein